MKYDFEAARDALSGKELFVFDMDGTIYLGERVFPEAIHFIKSLRDAGRRVLFFTNNASYADRLKWSVTDTTVFQPLTVDLQQGDLLEGLRKGLPGVRAGDECYLLFTGRYGFGKGRMGTVPVHAALAYHLWVQSVDNTQ